MGGLAVREAASLTGPGTGQPASASIGLIITIATPNTGSWDDGLFHNVRAGVGGTVPELLAWVVQGVCGGVGFVAGSGQPGEQRPGLCAEVQGSTAQAGSAMVPGSSQLSALPSPPSAVPLDAVAGNLTVTAKLFLIHTTYTLVPQGELGDLLVKPDSALAYGADSGNQEYTDACSMPVSELFGNLGWNGCTHGGLLYDPSTVSQVSSWVQSWIGTNTCIDQATATKLFLAAPVNGIQGNEQVEQVSCTAPAWAEGTIVSGANGVGFVAFHRVNGSWAYAASSGFFSMYCSQLSRLSAPASMLAQCPAGSTSQSTTTTTAPTMATPAQCPTSAQLLAAWQASPGVYPPDPQVSNELTGFDGITCWRNWVVANVVGNSNGTFVFDQTGGLHADSQAELDDFSVEVCADPSAGPGDWTNPADGPANCG
jgi:hypothetical protein